jgi:uroporphyrinogen-III synthase
MTDMMLVTRAQPGAERTAAALTARGIAALIWPMLTIAPRTGVDLDPASFAALAFTSAAGVSAFATARTERTIPAYAVGSGTAAALVRAGFTEIRAGDADAAALAARIAADRPGAILHVAGADLAVDLAARLADCGIEAALRTAYDTVFTSAEPTGEIADRLCRAHPAPFAAVLFHSPRGAQAFASLAARYAFDLTRTDALCLSEAVARSAASAPVASATGAPESGLLPWRRIAVGAAPTEEALLNIAGRTAGEA